MKNNKKCNDCKEKSVNKKVKTQEKGKEYYENVEGAETEDSVVAQNNKSNEKEEY